MIKPQDAVMVFHTFSNTWRSAGTIFSLRMNLDMGKLAYSYEISKDKDIPNTVVRCTTIPEELGRIGYLLSDKTGTLTQNYMVTSNLTNYHDYN